jgi:hypothetical protein
LRLERDVNASGHFALPRLAVTRPDVQLIRPEVASVGAHGDLQHAEDGAVEGLLAARSRTTSPMWSINRPQCHSCVAMKTLQAVEDGVTEFRADRALLDARHVGV